VQHIVSQTSPVCDSYTRVSKFATDNIYPRCINCRWGAAYLTTA